MIDDALAALHTVRDLVDLADTSVAPVPLELPGHGTAHVTAVFRWDDPDDPWAYTVTVPGPDGPVCVGVTVRHDHHAEADLTGEGDTTRAQVDALPAGLCTALLDAIEDTHAHPGDHPALERARQSVLAREQLHRAAATLADTTLWRTLLTARHAGTTLATLAADWTGDLAGLVNAAGALTAPEADDA